MKPLRTGIMGCGRIAKRHATILAGLSDVSLVAFCDDNRDSAQSFQQEFKCGEVYTDYSRMFAEQDLNLVYVCLPPFAHKNEVELACRHGVHMLIEKPIALTMTLAETMAAQVQAAGIKCQVGFMYRHGEAALWLKQYMAAQPAGQRLHDGALCLQRSAPLVVARPRSQWRPTGGAGHPYCRPGALLPRRAGRSLFDYRITSSTRMSPITRLRMSASPPSGSRTAASPPSPPPTAPFPGAGIATGAWCCPA